MVDIDKYVPWNVNYTTFSGRHVGFHITCQRFGSLHPICETNQRMDEAFSPDEIRDFGRLISAAPDLLAALTKSLAALEAISSEMTVGDRYTNAGEYLLEALEPSRKAVGKATGGAA